MEASDQKPASARLEQFRQALAIHGGFSNLCVAALGVKLSRLRIPSRRLRGKIYRTVFGAKYPPIDERELERPLEEFVSFNDLFTRGVRKEFRPLPADPDCFICPCDGT
ncbi:MAG TPA: hypothetical protein PLV92_28390, partial [Pirellulaceae bacterium]|nr:hypothetical protein [Pirellulaceae bacterium]